MRNCGLVTSIILALLGTVAHAQDTAIKADSQATDSSRRAAMIEPGVQKTTSTQTASTPVKVTANVFEKTEPVIVAEWDGGQLTNQEVSATLSTRRPPSLRTLTPGQFATLPRDKQVEVVKLLAWDKLLLAEARQAGIDENHPNVAKVVNQQAENLLNRIYYEEQVTPRLEETNLKAAREFYDSNIESRFTQPAIKAVRAVHVSTMELVTAEEGDTLEQLAEQISGDPDKAYLISQNRAPYFHRKVPAEIDDRVLSTPLRAGEVLYVPMHDAAVSSATALAERLRSQLLEGKTIEEITGNTTAADFAVSATENIQINEQAGYWKEILDAASELESTSVSQVVKTPVGLNLLVLENATTTNVLEFDQIKDILIREMTADDATRRENVEKTREQVLQRLWDKYNVQVNEDVLNNPNPLAPPDPLSTSTAVATVGDDFTYHLGQFIADLRLTGKDWGQLTKEERLEVLRIAPSITNYLTAREARELGLDNTEDFREKVQDIANAVIVTEYRKQMDDPEKHRVTDDELRAFYNDNLDKYTSPSQVKLREISKRINMTLPPGTKAQEVEDARKSLAEIRSRIKNAEDFAQLARRESEAISTRSRGGLIGTVPEDFRGEAFRNQVRQLDVGEISEPFLYGSEVMIIRLDERIAPTVQPFEYVRRQVMHDYAQTMPQKMRNQELEQALKNVNFRITF